MIPKIIHYCWFGDTPLNDEYKEYINEWRRFNPDFKIKEWNNNNIPSYIPYLETSINKKNWANASNYIRLYALRTEGGIYMDTDMKILGPLDILLNYHCFLGFESGNFGNEDYWVNNAIVGAIPNHEFIKDCEKTLLEKFDGTEKANLSAPHLVTEILKQKYSLAKYGEQLLADIMLFEKEVFYPLPYEKAYLRKNSSEWELTSKTIAIHMWGRSWFTQEMSIDLIDYYQKLKTEQQNINVSIQKRLDESEANLEVKTNELNSILSNNRELIQVFSALEALTFSCENHFALVDSGINITKNKINDLHNVINGLEIRTQQLIKENENHASLLQKIVSSQVALLSEQELLSKQLRLFDTLQTRLETLFVIINEIKKTQFEQMNLLQNQDIEIIGIKNSCDNIIQLIQLHNTSQQHLLVEQEKNNNILNNKIDNLVVQISKIFATQQNTENTLYKELNSLQQIITAQSNTINELSESNDKQSQQIIAYKEKFEEANILQIMFRKIFKKN
ncbi:alpha 1,4-glycosyltransferase [Lacibacter cauensis]|uniref:Alpha 1,4-glycosyltransferase n=1 Tax=Lacibacter cauensis TaxID=510947 RepID=A0A562SQY4_9BACT|nr:glycosyltransferase [Lacibacter cauensis]TWI83675.1 alpha 1,4-glycosyltransferase [Lacibacter cauensis]